MRIQELEREYGDDLVVEWRAFLLRPDPQVRDVEKFTHYTTRWNAAGGPGDQEPSIEFRTWSGTSPPPTHSMPSAIAGKVAQGFGADVFDAYHRAAMRAYFTDSRDISDPLVLAAIAGEVGLDVDDFATKLHARGAELHQLVLDEYASATDEGIHAVPTVVINNVFPLPGAQDLDAYRAILERHRTRP